MQERDVFGDALKALPPERWNHLVYMLRDIRDALLKPKNPVPVGPARSNIVPTSRSDKSKKGKK